MGRDLTLVIDPDETVNGQTLAYQRLCFRRDYSLFDLIQELPSFPMPEGYRFEWYADFGLADRSTDAHGEPLRYVLARAWDGLSKPGVAPWNRGVLAFLAWLPPDTKVWLYWC